MDQNVPKTRLAYLMQLTNVTGKILSSSLHVDMSLVSRWKNGKRSLNNNVNQLEKVCEFFVSANNGYFLQIVIQMIETEMQIKLSAHEKSSKEMIRARLCDWFVQKKGTSVYDLVLKSENSNHMGNCGLFYKSFIGNEGRRQGVVKVFELMLTLEQPHQLLIVNGENDVWLRENPMFFETWQRMIKQLISRGHQFITIRGNNRPIDGLFDEILAWVPFCLTGQVSIYVEAGTTYREYLKSFYLVEDICTLSGLSVEDDMECFTSVTNDLLTVQNHQKLVEKILNKCNLLVQVFDRFDAQKIKEAIILAGANNDNSYYMSDELFFSNMSRDLLEDVLLANACHLEQKERALSFHSQINKNFGQNVAVFENHHIYNYSSLEKLMKLASYQNNHLSFIAGRPIQMTRLHYIRHIEDTIHRLENNKDYNIALTNSEQKAILLEDYDIWIKDGYYLCIWSHKTYERIVISSEPSVTHVFTKYYQNLWQSIPFIEKDKATVIKRLKKLLKLAMHIEMNSET